jgi:hypothetical protein
VVGLDRYDVVQPAFGQTQAALGGVAVAGVGGHWSFGQGPNHRHVPRQVPCHVLGRGSDRAYPGPAAVSPDCALRTQEQADAQLGPATPRSPAVVDKRPDAAAATARGAFRGTLIRATPLSSVSLASINVC